MGFLSLVKDFVRGLLMGAADVIPGVSGGTMALIVGVYERLVAAISHAAGAAVRLLRGDFSGMMTSLQAVEWRLVLPLGLGIITALFIGARFIPGLLEQYPEQSRGLFFGLIAGSLIIPWRRITEAGLRAASIALGAALVAFVLVGLPPREIADPALFYVLGAASISICAMILPGVSGAFLLLVFGIYEPTLRALSDGELLYIGVFAMGAALGLGAFARLLTVLLGRFYDVTMAVLVGLMLGSLRALWPWLQEDRSLMLPETGDPIAPVLLLMLAGAGGVLALYLWSLHVSPARPDTASSSSDVEKTTRSEL